MAISITADDVRDAGDLDSADYPDGELTFEIDLAEAIVNDDLAPHSSNQNRLELTAALMAAAYAVDEQVVESVKQESATVKFDTEKGLSLWRQAKQADPTGKLETLEQPTASFEAY